MKKQLIIFSDYGLDDACALAYLLEHADRFDGIDVVCIAGNAPAACSLSNAQKLVNSGQWTVDGGQLRGQGSEARGQGSRARCPHRAAVRLVSTNDFPQNYARLPSIHGEDGMGDLFPKPETIDAVPYAEWAKSLPESVIILSLGPCTVSLDVVKRLKNLKASEHIVMGGMVKAVPNHLGMEFNQALDPGSFNAQVKFPHVIATLDTCRAPQFNLAVWRGKSDSLLHRLVNRANELAEARHPDNSYIYDLITALYLIEPQIFEARAVTDPWGNRLRELRLADKGFMLGEYLVL
ncbi:MAG: nucleoside hydrolase [Firmicutes bacterium]|nr:nucleoside hydrolase [Bacillota bacterium]